MWFSCKLNVRLTVSESIGHYTLPQLRNQPVFQSFACEENMAATLLGLRTEYQQGRSDWLKPRGD